MKLKQILSLPIGVILLAVAILMEKFLPETRTLDFIEGILMGLSIVFTITYIIMVSKKARKD
jgi:predicted Kef-type K+ transport protein